ncbi:hypothetical protein CCYA_CCYA08G2386 [Cyanidiococcus yangmingshanensis]|nr:hypothetical protein CCYA_CCYA08G2386 [Cyanidiococcus yangmingshanensis]
MGPGFIPSLYYGLLNERVAFHVSKRKTTQNQVNWRWRVGTRGHNGLVGLAGECAPVSSASVRTTLSGAERAEKQDVCVVEVFHCGRVHIGLVSAEALGLNTSEGVAVTLVSAENETVRLARDQVIANWSDAVLSQPLQDDLLVAGERLRDWLVPQSVEVTQLQEAWRAAQSWLERQSPEQWLPLEVADRMGILALLSSELREHHRQVSTRSARRGGPVTHAVELAARFRLLLRRRFRRRLWPADETASATALLLSDPLVLRMLAALMLGADVFRFKRVPRLCGGWRALSEPLVRVRVVESFCERACSPTRQANQTWHPEHLAVLRELEMLAASRHDTRKAPEAMLVNGNESGSVASRLTHLYPLAAAVCRRLERDLSPNSAMSLLVDLGQWTSNVSTSDSSSSLLESSTTRTRQRRKSSSRNTIAAFPDTVMAAARALRTQLLSERTRMQPSVANTLLAFCVDSSSARILDDAFSVEVEQESDGSSAHLPGERLARVTWHVHIADVGCWLPAGHPVDQVASQRAQSLYLPGRPLHLLPPPLANAASFSEHLPTNAVTVSLRFTEPSLEERTEQRRLGTIEWFDVRRSVVPPVLRISYEQLDHLILTNWRARSTAGRSDAADARTVETTTSDEVSEARVWISADHLQTLRKALASPALEHRMRIRMHSRQSKSAGRVAQVAHRRDGSLAVAEFALSPGYCLVDVLLAAASEALIRYALKHSIPVPLTGWARVQELDVDQPSEIVPNGKTSAAYRPQRCGTAPLRRYLDLVTLRQISLYLDHGDAAPLLTRAQVARISAQVQRNASKGMQKVTASRQLLMMDVLAERQAQAQSLGLAELIVRGLVLEVAPNCRTARIILDDDQLEAMVALEKEQHVRVGERHAFRLVRLDRTQRGAQAIRLALADLTVA